jgi:hypothetical protein
MSLVKKVNLDEWDAYSEQSPQSTIYHKSWWIAQTEILLHLNFQGFVINVDGQEYLLGCYLNKTKGTFEVGKIGYGGPLALRSNNFTNLPTLSKIIQVANEELAMPFNSGITFPSEKWDAGEWEGIGVRTTTHILPLSKDIAWVKNNVSDALIRDAHQAEKLGVAVTEVKDDPEIIEKCYNLIIQTQVDLGADYRTDKNFFHKIIHQPEAQLLSAIYRNEIISTVLFFVSHSSCTFYLHGWNRSFGNLNANKLLIWSMIENAVKHECLELNMGYSHAEELKKFKTRWGAKEVPILRYYLKDLV